MYLNFFKIKLAFEEFQIQEKPFSEEFFEEIKTNYNNVASFFRYGDSIYISPSIGFNKDLGNLRTIRVGEHPEIVRSLIRHLLFRSFRDDEKTKGMLLESFSPLSFFSRQDRHDPIRKHLPDELKQIIQYPRVHEVYVKSICPDKSHQFGILIKGRHTWRLNRNLYEMVKDGFDIIGRTVLETIPFRGLEGILADDESVLGQVQQHDGLYAQIMTNEGIVKREIRSLHLQKTPEQIRGYLKTKIGVLKTNAVFSSIKEYRDTTSASCEFTEIMRLARWFSNKEYRNNDGFCFSITTEVAYKSTGIQLEPTKLVFDISPGASKSKVLTGLQSHGPFDSSRYPNKKFKILAIFHSRQHGSVTSFIGKLINGIPDSKYYQQGFRDLFRLHDVEFDLRPIAAIFPEDYEKAIDQAIKENTGEGYNIALVECPDGSENVPIAHNPYYRSKVRLMSYGIPVQCVKESHLRRSSQQLAYTLGPIALQIYSKSGGVPWILPSSQSTDAELIIGIGNSIYRKNNWTGVEQSRVVGLTTFFNGDGRYLLGQESRTVAYRDYFSELLASLKRSLSNIAEEYGWEEGQTLRLVFHVFKPLKNTEIEVVECLIGELGFEVIFAFVTISRIHPWILHSGLTESRGQTLVEEAKRGDTFIIDHNSCLLQLCGKSDRPNWKQGLPTPVLVRIHEKSTYNDLPYITQQILDFSYLNWRSFFPSELPASIFYSSIMAKLSQRLEMVEGWNSTMLDKHFRRKTWFL